METEQQAILRVKNLSLARGGTTVLHDLSFDLYPGEILVILGPSGSGKSSLLRCLNRLEEPGRDQVFFRNRDVTALDVTGLRRQVGMIFQKPVVFEGSLAENIRYGPGLQGETLTDERIAALLEMVSLDPGMAHQDSGELSGGEEQRLTIARALANQPAILLLDEPTSALDPAAVHHVEESLLRLREELRLTMVWVSHAVEQARRVADRLIFLEAGQIKRIGDAATLLHPENGDSDLLAFAAGSRE